MASSGEISVACSIFGLYKPEIWIVQTRIPHRLGIWIATTETKFPGAFVTAEIEVFCHDKVWFVQTITLDCTNQSGIIWFVQSN